MKFVMREFYDHQPVKNHINGSRCFDGCLFDMEGEEFEFVRAQPDENVWTLVDCDGYSFVVTGLTHECALGYIVMRKPWTEDREIEIPTS